MPIKKLKYIIMHSSAYGLGTIFAQAAGFLLLPFYTSYLTPRDYGIAAIVETTISIIAMFATMGINSSIARFYSEKNDWQYKNLVISTTYIIIWLISLICIPAIWILSIPFSSLLFKSSEYGIFFMLSGSALFAGFNFDIGLAYFNLRKKAITYVSLSLLNTILLISFNVYFIAFMNTGLIGIFYSVLITKGLLAIVMTVPIIIKIRPNFSLSIALRMIKYSFPLGISNIFRTMTQQSDKFIINYFFSPVETGIYAIASKIAFGVHILLTTNFLKSYHPIRFEIMKETDGPRTYGVILEQYLLAIGSFGLIIALFSNEIIWILTTHDFYRAALFIPPLILAWILFGMKYHLENGILISMKTKYITYIVAAASVINVGLNLMTIPHIGIWGAVLASNISNVFISGSSFLISQKYYKIQIDWRRVLNLFLCLLLCFILSLFASRLEFLMAIFVKTILMLAYCWSIFALRIIEPDIFLSLKRKLTRGVSEKFTN